MCFKIGKAVRAVWKKFGAKIDLALAIWSWGEGCRVEKGWFCLPPCGKQLIWEKKHYYNIA